MLIKVEMLDIDTIIEDSNEGASNIQMNSDDIDGKPIAQLNNLKKDRIKHRCNVCSKYFQKNHRYEAHLRIHNGLKVRNFVKFKLSVNFIGSHRATSVNCARISL